MFSYKFGVLLTNHIVRRLALRIQFSFDDTYKITTETFITINYEERIFDVLSSEDLQGRSRRM